MTPHLPSALALVRLALLAAVLLGCDKGGLYPLLEARDPAASVDCDQSRPSSTWLRSTAVGTEFLVIASPTPGEALGAVCFSHGLVEHDSSSTYAYGSLTTNAAGAGRAAYAATYTFDYVSTGAILDRRGSYRDVHTPPRVAAITLRDVGAQLEATIDGEKGRYTNLYDVVADIDLSTQAGAEDAFRLVNLPLFTSQVRLLGFGGGGMTQYISAPGTFVGLAREDAPEAPNAYNVRVQAFTTPNTDIDYIDFEDFSGVVLDGLQETDVNISGNGSMHGVLTWTLSDGMDPVAGVALRGTIDYENIQIGNGVASGGTYEFVVTEPTALTFTVPYTLASDVDLRGLLPEDR